MWSLGLREMNNQRANKWHKQTSNPEHCHGHGRPQLRPSLREQEAWLDLPGHSWLGYTCPRLLPDKEHSRDIRTGPSSPSSGLLYQSDFAQRFPISLTKTFPGLHCGLGEFPMPSFLPSLSLLNKHQVCTTACRFSSLLLFPSLNGYIPQ